MRAPTPRVAVTAVFFLNGVVFSSWYARLPTIQESLRLSAGQLGVALLAAPVGLLLAQAVTGAVIARVGSRRVVAAAPLLLAPVVLPALAPDLGTLALAVLFVGAANGALDIAMNAQGVAVERAAGRRLFGSLHAAYSFGALGGALAAAAAAAAGVPPLLHLGVAGTVGAVAAAGLAPALHRDPARPGAPRWARPTRRLAALGVIAFCVLLAEGAVFDWSGIYLATVATAAAAVTPLGLAAFSVTMGVGRLLGDRVAERIGSVATLRTGATLAALGIGLALAWAEPPAAIIGFAVMGLGLSVGFPLALRAAALGNEALGDQAAGDEAPGDQAAGPALAATSMIGYTGLLAGPPLIGLLADAVGLRVALALVCLLCLVAVCLATQVREPLSIAAGAARGTRGRSSGTRPEA